MANDELKYLQGVDDVFKNRNITFEDIDKLTYKQFNRAGPKAEAFKPSDILDMNEDDSDDEILRKFRGGRSPAKRSPRKPPVRAMVKNDSSASLGRNYAGTQNTYHGD